MPERANAGTEGWTWYEADALLADLTSHRHTMKDVSEGGVERRIRARYRDPVAVLVRAATTGMDHEREDAWRR